MKTSARYISSALLMAALAMPAHAQTLTSGAQVEGAGIVRLRDSVVISMNIRLDGMKVESNRSVVLQPLLEEPMLAYVRAALRPLFGDRILTVIGHGAEENIQRFLSGFIRKELSV